MQHIDFFTLFNDFRPHFSVKFSHFCAYFSIVKKSITGTRKLSALRIRSSEHKNKEGRRLRSRSSRYAMYPKVTHVSAKLLFLQRKLVYRVISKHSCVTKVTIPILGFYLSSIWKNLFMIRITAKFYNYFINILILILITINSVTFKYHTE